MNNSYEDELPDLPADFQTIKNVDLHLGAAEVKPLSPWVEDPSWWIRNNMPGPGPGIFVLDCIIGIMTMVMLWLIVDTVVWMFS